MRTKRIRAALLLLLTALTLSACAAEEPPETEPEPDPGVTTLIYAKISKAGADQTAINRFNRTHDGVQIEIRNYYMLSENNKAGLDLLLTEITAGKIPDIIELGFDNQFCEAPYRHLAEKGYLEDLWPYIKGDPRFADRMMEAPLKAIEVNGGLYALFDSVLLHTMAGPADVVGKRNGWTAQEMMDALASLPERAELMDGIIPEGSDNSMSEKDYLLCALVCSSLDLLVDWDSGACHFDSRHFRDILEMVKSLPEKDSWRDDCMPGPDEHAMRLYQRRQSLLMLGQECFRRLYVLRKTNFEYGGKASCVGYPTADGSVGSYFEPLGIKLAMSSTCKDKEAAWEYILEQTIRTKKLLRRPDAGGYESLYDGLPINKTPFYKVFRKTATLPPEDYSVFAGGQLYPTDSLSTEDMDELLAFYNSVTRSSLMLEPKLFEMIRYEASAYFADILPLDQVIQRIQSKAYLYINEQK